MEFKMLRFVVEDAVATITLDYAPTLNALDMNLALELEAALKQAEEDAGVKVVVLTGAGRAFCGGGDIRFMKAHCEEPDFADKSMGPLAGKLSEIVLYIKKMTKLVICAVAGAAAGGGCNLALGCDFVFAADNAKFLQAFVGIALIPDTGGGYMLPRAIGTHRAMDMFVTGRPVSAQECFELGLVKEVTTADELLPKATAFAKKLAAGPTLAYANMKKMMFISMYQGFEDFAKAEVALQNECAASADFREGITAFLEKSSILQKEELNKEDLIFLLGRTNPDEIKQLYDAAYETKKEWVGNVDYYRGLLEFSNRCIKNCNYCGIRRDNGEVERFDTPREDILTMARWCYEQQYGSVTLQSGERQDEAFIDFVEGLLRDIKSIGNGALGITLCVGEQTKETYQRWYNAGAHRYLLRIESCNPKLYATLHPQDGHHKWDVRKACLDSLAEIGYQVGTGVMIGLPGQTLEDLAEDILFYKKQNIAMIGMGPYVVHHNTPLGKKVCEAGLDTAEARAERLRLSINMVAVTRLFLKDVNIAATTAMQTLHPLGREMALKAGANILMPLVTLPQFRSQYQLYDNKPCLEDGQEQCRNCLSARVASVGDTVGWGQWGDSPHFFNNLK